MQIGELFLNLGIKGSEKTIDAISDVKGGLKDVASTSLEAKAAIIGAVYALERLFATSGQVGTNLTNFSTLTGVATKTFQEYAFAASRVGATNQETEATFKSLQASMAQQLLTGKGPAGIAQVSMKVGGFTREDIANFAKQPQLLIQKLQEYAKKETNVELANSILKTFGLSDNLIAALRAGVFNQENFKKAPLYTDKEIESLNKANIGWADLGRHFEMAFGHFNAAFGPQIVGFITKIGDSVLRLGEALVKLASSKDVLKSFENIKAPTSIAADWKELIVQAEALKKAFSNLTGVEDAFKVLDTIIKGWGLIFGNMAIVLDGIATLNKATAGLSPEERGKRDITNPAHVIGGGEDKGKESLGERLENAFLAGGQGGGESLLGILVDYLSRLPHAGNETKYDQKTGKELAPATPEKSPSLRLVPSPSASSVYPRSIAPPVSAAVGNGSTQNIEVNQNLHFQHDGKDAAKTGDSTKKAVKDAFRQLPSQAQGS